MIYLDDCYDSGRVQLLVEEYCTGADDSQWRR
jgi:hypothetical protein